MQKKGDRFIILLTKNYFCEWLGLLRQLDGDSLNLCICVEAYRRFDSVSDDYYTSRNVLLHKQN